MAIYRSIQMSFWTDVKVVDDFTPEDKFFYLYLLTNPHTNLCGCYEISFKQMSDETGYTKEVIERLIDRMENNHNVIRFSKTTREILILNWSKFNWTSSKDFCKPLIKEIEMVKNADFKDFLQKKIEGVKTVYTPSYEGVGTTVTVTVSDTDNNIYTKDSSKVNHSIQSKDSREDNNIKYIYTHTEKEKKKKEKEKESLTEIIDYLNLVLGTRYTTKNETNNGLIRARLNEGHTVEDFKTVIDNMYRKWHEDAKMRSYLRPQTLFSSKFESYLNESAISQNRGVGVYDEHGKRQLANAERHGIKGTQDELPF